MGAGDKESFLSRPPKLHPATSLLLGLVCIPVGFVLKGPIGGGLVGGGIGALLMAAWDSGRLRYVRWRRSGAAERHTESQSDCCGPGK